MQTANLTKKITLGAVALIALSFLGSCFYTVNSYEAGVLITFGKISDKPVGDGLHAKLPFVQRVAKVDLQVQKLEGLEVAYTKDIQTAEVTYVLNYEVVPSSAADLYKNVGYRMEERVIEPVVKGVLKDAFGNYNAASIVENRDAIRVTIEDELKAQLSGSGSYVHNLHFQIANVDYDDRFEEAIVAKQVAEQDALAAKNMTIKIEEQAKQTRIQAEAEADAIKIKASAMANNPKIVSYEAVQKWDGKLPTYMLGQGTVPFLDLK